MWSQGLEVSVAAESSIGSDGRENSGRAGSSTLALSVSALATVILPVVLLAASGWL